VVHQVGSLPETTQPVFILSLTRLHMRRSLSTHRLVAREKLNPNTWRKGPQKVVPFWSLAWRVGGRGGCNWMQWTQYKSGWIHKELAKYETNMLIRPLKKRATPNRIHVLPLLNRHGWKPLKLKKKVCICEVWNAWFNVTYVYAKCSARCYTAHYVT
jgi:hypothetical protein